MQSKFKQLKKNAEMLLDKALNEENGSDKKLLNDALHAYLEYIKVNNKDADAYYNMGIIYNKLGHYQEAINVFNKSIMNEKIKAKKDNATYYISHSLYLQGELKKQIAILYLQNIP